MGKTEESIFIYRLQVVGCKKAVHKNTRVSLFLLKTGCCPTFTSVKMGKEPLLLFLNSTHDASKRKIDVLLGSVLVCSDGQCDSVNTPPHETD